MSTLEKNLLLAARAEKMGDETIVDIEMVAALLSQKPGAVRQWVYKSPGKVPPRLLFESKSRQPLRWRLGDVREWIRRRANSNSFSEGGDK